MSKKILVIGKYYPPYMGGIEHVTKLCCEAINKDFNVRAIVNNDVGTSKTEIINHVAVDRLSRHFNFSSQPIALALPFSYRCADYDLVHLHGPNPYGAAILAAKWFLSIKKPKLIVTHHMDIFGRKLVRLLTLPFYRYLLRRSDFVIVTSLKNFSRSNDIPRTVKLNVVPLSVDPTRYDLTEEARAASKEWRRHEFGSARLIGFVGRHARYKGLDVLLHAMTQLPDAHLVLAGDGEFRADLIKLTEKLGLTNRVHFPGAISDQEKSRLLMAIDVFAFPSTEVTEAFGISQLEAMLHRAPVVASNLPTGVTDVAIDNVTALLVPPGNVNELSGAITQMLSDASLASRLGAAGQHHVKTNFVDSVVSTHFNELVASTLSPI